MIKLSLSVGGVIQELMMQAGGMGVLLLKTIDKREKQLMLLYTKIVLL